MTVCKTKFFIPKRGARSEAPSSLKRIRIKFKSILNLDLSENKNRHFRTNSLFHSYTWTCQTKIVIFYKSTFPFLYLDLSDKNCQFRTNSLFSLYTWTCQTNIVIFGQSHFSHSIPGPVRQTSSFSDKVTFLPLYLDLSEKYRHFRTNSLFSLSTRTCQTNIVIFGQSHLDLSDKYRHFRTKSLFSLYTWTY